MEGFTDVLDIGQTMTVGKLMEELGKFDKELPVITEGCDCYGPAIKVEGKIEFDEARVYILRRDWS